MRILSFRNRNTDAGNEAIQATSEYINKFRDLMAKDHSKKQCEDLLLEFLSEVDEIIDGMGSSCSKNEEKELEGKRAKLVSLYVQCINSASNRR